MIEVEHISKTYRVARRDAGLMQAVKALWRRETEEIRALDDISFSISDGEMVGYIGPNGAGKSSTIKVLSGVLTPDKGSCRINGRVPWKQRKEHVSHIGVVFGQRSGLWWDVPVIDSFELLKEIYRVPEAVYRDSLEELVTLLDLEMIIAWAADALRNCSGAAAPAGASVPGRADDWPGCGFQACCPRFYPADERGTWHNGDPDDA